jgi:hypothetical protein
MPSDLAKLAYSRLLNDLQGRVFYRHPKEVAFVEAADLDAWLDELEEKASKGEYVADPFPVLEVPKAGWHIRPGIQLSLADQFIYHFLALQAVVVIGPRIEWSAQTVRFSYRLSSPGKKYWFKWRFHGWKNFAKVSLGKLSGANEFVLVSDISGYYENIDIGRLVQEMQAARVDDKVTGQLSRLWNKWCGIRQRGIPQGFSPSDLFAEFYLDPLDHGLQGAGLDHLRYVDDIRIFTTDEKSAHRGLHELERTLRSRGLNPQTAKTKVRPAEVAKEDFSRIQRLLGQLSKKMGDELQLVADAGGQYISPSELRDYLKFDPDAPKPEVVNQAWQFFVDEEFGPFDATLFHYLLARLGDQRSPNAEAYSLKVLTTNPEETEYVLGYFSSTKDNLAVKTIEALAALLKREAELLFEHQRYLILRWFYEEQIAHEVVLDQARLEAHSGESRLLQPHWIAYLGDHATDQNDFVKLERSLQSETGALMRATYLYALRRWESTDRNLLYARCAGECREIDGAIKCAKADTA